jgi:hypothetical protein
LDLLLVLASRIGNDPVQEMFVQKEGARSRRTIKGNKKPPLQIGQKKKKQMKHKSLLQNISSRGIAVYF